mmetsp:Transcript_13030/g.19509  ORF Transcript_13030/g.19509 Transcript_13030/m.19509 type:complete len:711 (-) Transcript_13030:730-2862(-)
MTPDQVFSMQMELTQLRNKVAQYSKLGGNVGMGSKVDELVQIMSEKESEIIQLSNENKYYHEKFASVQSLLTQVEEERTSLVKAKANVQKQLDKTKNHLDVRDNEVVQLQLRVQEHEQRKNRDFKHLKSDNAVLKAEVADLQGTVATFEEKQVQFEVLKREKFQSDVNARDAIARAEDMQRNHDRTVESLNASLTSLKRTMKEQEAMEADLKSKIQKAERFRIDQVKKLKAEIATVNKERVEIKNSYEQKLKSVRQEKDKLVQDHKAAIDDMDRELSQLRLTASDEQSNFSKQLSEAKELVSLQEKDISRKENEIQLLKCAKEESDQRIEEYKLKVTEFEQHLADRDNELLELRTSKLSLEQSLAESETRLHESDISSRERAIDAKTQLNKAEANVKALELETRRQSATVNKLKDSLQASREAESLARSRSTDIRSQLDKSQATVKALELENRQCAVKCRKLEDSLDTMGKQKRSSEQKNIKLQAELDLLINSQRAAKEGHTLTIKSLQAEIYQLKSDLDAKSNALRELDEARSALEERKETLLNMVTQNRQLSDDYAEARILVSDLQDEMDSYIREKSCAETKLLVLEKQFAENEAKLKEDLQKERIARMQVEADLVKTRQNMILAKKKEKQTNELEKENGILKDKIKRQEAFLQKKLRKERTLRQSKVNNNISKRNSLDSLSIGSKDSKDTMASFEFYESDDDFVLRN